jgi:two-component system, LytTR family, sensor kinase
MRMPWPIPIRSLAAIALVYAACAALLSFAFTQSTGLSRWTMLPAGPARSYLNLLAIGVVTWCGWALLAAGVFALGRRFPFGRSAWPLALAVHAVASIAVATALVAVVASVRVVLQRWWGLSPVWWDSVHEAFFRTIDFHVPIYWALLGLQHAVDYHREVRARDVAAARLETRLVEAQLQALHRQVHPHFLFNTLHAISALVHRDPDRADAMIERLSDMLRVTLSTVGVQEVTVRQELDFLRAYLDIEQVNFGARLRVLVDIDPGTLDALVPNLVLQPLAENALRHGLAPLPGGGTLAITVRRDGESLVAQIGDDGMGWPGRGDDRGHGVGLSNTRARLDVLHRGAAALTIAPRPGGGVLATLRLPFRLVEVDLTERQAS